MTDDHTCETVPRNDIVDSVGNVWEGRVARRVGCEAAGRVPENRPTARPYATGGAVVLKRFLNEHAERVCVWESESQCAGSLEMSCFVGFAPPQRHALPVREEDVQVDCLVRQVQYAPGDREQVRPSVE